MGLYDQVKPKNNRNKRRFLAQGPQNHRRNFSELGKNIPIKVQEANRKPSRWDQRRKAPSI